MHSRSGAAGARGVRFSAALLDVDGTLLLSNDAHAHAWHDALAEFGYDVPPDALRRLMGMGGDKVLRTVDATLHDDRPPGSEIGRRRAEIFKEQYLGTVRAAPGARELVQVLLEHDIRCVVATSAKDDELKSLLRAARVDDLINVAATSDDAKHSKPDPDIVDAALKRAEVKPQEAVLLGDTPYDLEAAEKAGVAVIAVRCGGWNDTDLSGALAIYDDPAALAREFQQSPFVV